MTSRKPKPVWRNGGVFVPSDGVHCTEVLWKQRKVCGRPVKYKVIENDGCYEFLCGIHVRFYRGVRGIRILMLR
jgi:hypothetical protein